MEEDLLKPSEDKEFRLYKLKRLVQAPNSYFMDVKCFRGCPGVTPMFSHGSTIIPCRVCGAILGKPTGGKMKMTPGVAFKIKK